MLCLVGYSFSNDRFATTAPATLVSGLDTKKIVLEFFETTDEDGRLRALAAGRPAEQLVLGILYFVLQAVIVVLQVKADLYIDAIDYFQGQVLSVAMAPKISASLLAIRASMCQDHARSCMQP